MAIKTFKEIIDNKGYRINSNDRKIFEEGNLQSFFGLGTSDAIEFIVYDSNDNPLPQQSANNGTVRYITLTTENIQDYFLIAEGTIFQKYKLPSEYFIDAERLLREAGYNNGIFKTQISLINKRVGSEKENDKLWISEISPSRTEIRLFPLRNAKEKNKELEERFKLFVQNGEFRDDTVNLVFNFLDKIKPNDIDSFIITKYGEKWFNKLIGEFKIKQFDNFSTTIFKKFKESALYEFTNRISDLNDINYGKPKKTNPPIKLSKSEILEICKKLLVKSLDFYLAKLDIRTTTSFDSGNLSSIDLVYNVLQRTSSDTQIDTSSPELRKVIAKPVSTTDAALKFKRELKKQFPVPEPGPINKNLPDPMEDDTPIITPKDEPPYVPDPPPPPPVVLVPNPNVPSGWTPSGPTPVITPGQGGGGGGGTPYDPQLQNDSRGDSIVIGGQRDFDVILRPNANPQE